MKLKLLYSTLWKYFCCMKCLIQFKIYHENLASFRISSELFGHSMY